MFSRNVGDKVVPVTVSASGLYCSATVDSRTGRIYLKIVNAAAQAVLQGANAVFSYLCPPVRSPW